MASAMGMIGIIKACSSSPRMQANGKGRGKKKSEKKNKNNNNNNNRVRFYSSSSSVKDAYKTLRIQHGASESEVKKAFRKLARQYHPDVCKGNNCGVQFHTINEAYEIVMKNLRGELKDQSEMFETFDDETAVKFNPDELWQEWMGWEGAGIRDYSSHINPYI